jgi:polyphenol oxidase
MHVLKADILNLPRVVHGFFGRDGGVSEGVFASLNGAPTTADRIDHVLENRRRIADWFGRDVDYLSLIQYHSADVVTVEAPWTIERMPRADALVTKRPGIALGVNTADCAPVLLCDPEAGVIGAAHAGWKGALVGVCEATVDAMVRIGAERGRIRAAIGPCIAQPSYEVGADFRAQYPQTAERFFLPAPREQHFLFDNEAYVGSRLAAAGVTQIEALHVDTFAEETAYFSFRRTTLRAEPDGGREVSAIMLTSP